MKKVCFLVFLLLSSLNLASAFSGESVSYNSSFEVQQLSATPSNSSYNATSSHIFVLGRANSSNYNLSSLEYSAVQQACTEDWSCDAWSSCSGGAQTRECTDANTCGTTTNKPATTQSCSSGGSGGRSGGAGVNTPLALGKTESIDLKSSASKDLKIGDKLLFNVVGDGHSLTVKKIRSSDVTLEIASSVFESTIKLKETKSYDLNNNGIHDLTIEVAKIAGSTVTLIVKNLETVSPISNTNSSENSQNTQEEVIEELPVNTPSLNQPDYFEADEKKAFDPKFLILIVVISLALVGGAGYVMFKRNPALFSRSHNLTESQSNSEPKQTISNETKIDEASEDVSQQISYQKIVDYIMSQENKGVTAEVIRQNLLSVNWPEALVNEALQKVSKENSNKNLIIYIYNQRQKGISDEIIRQKLLQAGWPEGVIDELIGKPQF